MALSAATVWEVRTAGNDTNGGGFTTGASGVDYSQQDAKNTAGNNISTTDVVGAGTTTITSATASFTADIVGNIIYLQGGSASLAASRYRVMTFSSATAIILDRAVGAGTGITMNIGGAVASLGILGSTTAVVPVSGNKIYIKAGTYVITSATPNISNGCFSTSTSMYIEGYETVREDLGAKPLIQADGVIVTFTLISFSSLASKVRNLELDGNNRTLSRGLTAGNALTVYRCLGRNFTNSAFVGTVNTSLFIECVATGCSTAAAFLNASCVGCVAHSNTMTGFQNIAGVFLIHCISYSNTGANTDGFLTNASTPGGFINCVAYANGRDGFRFDNISGSAVNCIAEDNAGIGFGFGSSSGGEINNCAGFDNIGGDVVLSTGLFHASYNFVTGTSSFFTNAAAGDFSLNDTAGGGADARAAGIPGIFPSGLTTGYLDIGAAQHQPIGGGGEHSAVF